MSEKEHLIVKPEDSAIEKAIKTEILLDSICTGFGFDKEEMRELMKKYRENN